MARRKRCRYHSPIARFASRSVCSLDEACRGAARIENRIVRGPPFAGRLALLVPGEVVLQKGLPRLPAPVLENDDGLPLQYGGLPEVAGFSHRHRVRLARIGV